MDDDIQVSLVAGMNKVSISGFVESFEIVGSLQNENVIVENIYYGGEGSGSFWDKFLDMLKKSKGKLIASQVWEGGESITRLTVLDGVVTEEELEI